MSWKRKKKKLGQAEEGASKDKRLAEQGAATREAL